MLKLLSILLLVCAMLVIGGCRQQSAGQPEQLGISAPLPQTDFGSDLPVSEAQNVREEVRVAFGSYDNIFRFVGAIPSEYQVEYIPEIRSINIYDPKASGSTPREQSQIFIRFFEASSFLTLSTVDILKREETTLKGHAAVRYEIQKKNKAVPFPSQPRWRNEKHSLIDVRLSEADPSVFYVFAFAPELPKDISELFMSTLVFDNDNEGFMPPLNMLRVRAIKKPFAMKVSPDNSPIQPERFSGYHTGIDFEVFDTERDDGGGIVEVAAFCGGKIKEKKQTSGYGGVVAQECLVGNNAVTVVYGHLRLLSVPAEANSYVAAGDTLGVLGTHGSPETDGERRHLHFGIHRGSSVDIRGYVQSQTELKQWFDPAEYLDDLR